LVSIVVQIDPQEALRLSVVLIYSQIHLRESTGPIPSVEVDVAGVLAECEIVKPISVEIGKADPMSKISPCVIRIKHLTLVAIDKHLRGRIWHPYHAISANDAGAHEHWHHSHSIEDPKEKRHRCQREGRNFTRIAKIHESLKCQ
jgi:hypothetical protein